MIATGLGAIFGFQSWRLAEYGFALTVPWQGVACIVLSHILLGFSIGVTAGRGRWWKRGAILGLAWSLPAALGALWLGLTWVPYGVAAIAGGVAAGWIIAAITDAAFPGARAARDERAADSMRPGSCAERRDQNLAAATRQRLSEEEASLERLDAERARRGDAGFGKTTEERIIWSELIDLELQDIDERVQRIREAAGEQSGHRSWISKGHPNSSSK